MPQTKLSGWTELSVWTICAILAQIVWMDRIVHLDRLRQHCLGGYLRPNSGVDPGCLGPARQCLKKTLFPYLMCYESFLSP
jgi:hypothetical protein